MDNETAMMAIKHLREYLEVPGGLKFAAPRYSPESNSMDIVWENVVKIDAHPHKEWLLRAYTAEGSTIDAEPETLLQKLREYIKV